MTQTVTGEDGVIHNFPDEATPAMIAGALGVAAPTESGAKPENNNFIQSDPKTGQSYFEGVHFGPVYNSEQDKIKALQAGGLPEVLKQSVRDTGNDIAAPINILLHAGNSVGRAVTTLPLEAADAVAGTNLSKPLESWLPEYRSPTDSTAENIASSALQYGVPTTAALKAAGPVVAGLSAAPKYLGQLGTMAAAAFGVTDPNNAATLGDAVGGPTEITPTDGPLEKRAKVAAETALVTPVADAVMAGGAGVGRMAKSFFGPSDPAEAQATLDAFNRQKVEAPAAAIAQNSRLSNADNALSSLPMSSQRMADQRGRITGEETPLPGNSTLPERVAAVSGNKSTGPIDAGNAIQEGSQQYVDKFQQMADKRFRAFDAKMPQDTPVVPDATRATIAALHPTAFGNQVADRTMNPALKSLVDDLTAAKVVDTGVVDASGNPITRVEQNQDFYGMKLLRDKVGKMMRDPNAGIPGAELKQLYGSITEDMRNTVANKSPALLKEFDNNSDFYKKGLASIDATAGKFTATDKAGNYVKNPENVYTETMGAQNSTERASQWRKLRNQLPKDKWEVVQSEEIRNLGVPNSSNPNDFSVQTYLKKWNDLTPAEKDVLFSGQKYTGMRKDLEDLATINDSLAKVKGFKNASNTAPQSWYMRLLSGGGATGAVIGGISGGGVPGAVTGAAVEAATRAALPYGASRIMTSQGFVHWLADGSKAAARDPSTIPSFIARLGAVAAQEKDSGTKQDILDYQKKAQEQLKTNPPAAVKPGASNGNVNPNLVAAIGKLESNNNPNAKGDGSSAQGAHQFTDSTWQRMVNKFGKAEGITMADRNDPQKSAVMAQHYAEENFTALKSRIGRDPTDAEIYMAHVLGPGGAARAIKEYSGDKTAAQVFPDAAAVPGNKSLFFKGNSPKSMKDFYSDMAKKLAAA